MRENSKCPHCGTFPRDWLDDRGRERLGEGSPYDIQKEKCWGCVNMDLERKQIPERSKGINLFYVRNHAGTKH